MNKLMWHSNSPLASTGYAQQTALFTKRLKEHYDVTISAFYGVEGNILYWEGIPVLPGIAGTYGNETITEHIDVAYGDRREGLVLTLMDVWTLNPSVWAQFDVASWVPVDHEPVPGPVYNFFCNSGAVPIAMSKFGREQLADLDPLYCPHAVDTEVFCPRDRADSREVLGLESDAFIVGMVAANKGNPSRKCFAEAFQAFKALHDRHPKALLYLHTEAKGRFQGVDLIELAEAVGLSSETVRFCNQYRTVHLPIPASQMAQVYSAMDVLLCASAGEGFGVPVIEAQACGTPVIVSDFSAQPELCKSGWLVTGHRQYMPIGSWQFSPDVGSIYEALEECYGLSDAARGEYAQRAREGMAEYDVERVLVEHMLPSLAEAAARHDARKPVDLKVAA